jgi:hypothetical protein
MVRILTSKGVLPGVKTPDSMEGLNAQAKAWSYLRSKGKCGGSFDCAQDRLFAALRMTSKKQTTARTRPGAEARFFEGMDSGA